MRHRLAAKEWHKADVGKLRTTMPMGKAAPWNKREATSFITHALVYVCITSDSDFRLMLTNVNDINLVLWVMAT
jgi:hypothetical protein